VCSVWHTEAKYSKPPAFDIPKRLIQNLLEVDFTISDVAKLLSVSERTLHRRMQQYNISKLKFSDCSDDELDVSVASVSLEFPFCGESFLGQILRTRGIHVQRYRLRESLHRVDNKGVNERKKGRLKRRVYNVQGECTMYRDQITFGTMTHTIVVE
jgi:AraC-like DNA-binding protein